MVKHVNNSRYVTEINREKLPRVLQEIVAFQVADGNNGCPVLHGLIADEVRSDRCKNGGD
jgi:hypothetical protein